MSKAFTVPTTLPTLTLREAAAQLDVSVQTLQTQIRLGKLAATKVEERRGDVWLVSPEEVQRYKEQSRNQPGRKRLVIWHAPIATHSGLHETLLEATSHEHIRQAYDELVAFYAAHPEDWQRQPGAPRTAAEFALVMLNGAVQHITGAQHQFVVAQLEIIGKDLAERAPLVGL
jgi:excisionase family DNA binding protein